MTLEKENLLDFVGYHEKWHGQPQSHRKKYEFNQNDFLIEEIFKRIGVEGGTFVEFGAWDGIKGSNTRKLFLNGWGGILIEPEEDRFNDLQKNYLNTPNVITINSFVTSDGSTTFDNLVNDYVTDGIDFCSIDIDGLDLDVFEAIEKHLPTVVCIEGGQMLSPVYQERLPIEISSENMQQGLFIMNKSFEEKGYKILCSYQDTFFIKKEHYHLFNTTDDLIELYLDGILAYPRIPWILQKISEVNSIFGVSLSNDFLLYVTRDVPYCHPQAPTEHKILWVNENYSNIVKNIENIRQTYRQKIRGK